ncbi:MAG: hypothetical protein ACI9SJ_002023 [Flavobacteriaceae bacterium]|uniref:DUF4301 family protein n=1 Tax=Candidatus Marifrigoribacter sp. Uisw_064 TaxID=3230970 RepID=UPI003AEB6711
MKKNLIFSEKDLKQIKQHNLTLEKVNQQKATFINSIPFVEVITSASVGNGIEVISKDNQQKLISFYEDKKESLDIVKFVPASGAATRMFKFLHSFLEDYNPELESISTYLNEGDKKDLETFFNSYKDFAFVNDVRKKIREKYPDYKHGTKGVRYQLFVKTMLGNKGLNFSNLPKGLIPFHKYQKYATTAFEEQLLEAAYFASVGNDVYLHFTFSKNHVNFFKEKFNEIKTRVSKKTKKEFHISYSFQKNETDTIAVHFDNTPFRNKNEELVFRPSGHGALLSNLNEVDADVIFIKNIDNVVAEEYIEPISYYKKVLVGKMLWVQKKVFSYIKLLDNTEMSLELSAEIKSFLWNELNIKDVLIEKETILEILNRPIRVCGVVKNTGAPGGGPFWVKDRISQTTSLQIVEMSQIDPLDNHQQTIINEATHFNPVDIVCGIRDYKGNKFDLSNFTDPNSGIITEKSQDGKPLKALELPGLWNGAMSNWNTALVEVPLFTFNPVKTVNDLLKKEHRPNA